MTDIEWGPAIAVDGKRPGWLCSGEWRRVRTLAVGEWQTADIESPGDTIPDMDEWNWGDITAIRLPADHPHYRQPAPIDWSGELEAVHEDGRVRPAFAVDKRRVSDYRGVRIEGEVYQGVQQEYWFHEDGLRVHDRDWRIRKVTQHTPQADTKPDVTARMEALVRRMAVIDYGEINAMPKERADAHWEARAIVALLPEPVDPDLIEARAIALKHCCPAIHSNSGTTYRTNQGEYDNEPYMRAIKAALARGRELALAGEKGK